MCQCVPERHWDVNLILFFFLIWSGPDDDDDDGDDDDDVSLILSAVTPCYCSIVLGALGLVVSFEACYRNGRLLYLARKSLESSNNNNNNNELL